MKIKKIFKKKKNKILKEKVMKIQNKKSIYF